VPFDLELYLLRHGDAGRRTAIAASPVSSDLPLTIAGREEIAVLARSLKHLNLKFEIVYLLRKNLSNILKSDFNLVVYNRTAEKGHSLVDDELMSTFLIKANTETNARMEIAEIAKEASIPPRTATRRIEKM
jgi:hypothetical protein